jgi:competence protein ComEA
MGWKQFAADYLQFSRKDRIAISSILVLILGVFFLPDFVAGKGGKPLPADTSWVAALRRLEQQEATGEPGRERYADNVQSYQYDRVQDHSPKRPKGELFPFDPNTLSAGAWKRLGLRDKTIATIRNYLSKGGQFRKPEDLQKVYGLFPDEYERIAPYIRISSTYEKNSYKNFAPADTARNYPAKKFTGRYTVIDINTADTSALIALPGIGNKLAARIINFRDRLGGFISINQVGETFGLPDSTFQKIKQWLKLENSHTRKININTATLDELKTHPYIRYVLANAIIAYRNEHGPFLTLEDLKKIMVVTNEVFGKIAPYLVVED